MGTNINVNKVEKLIPKIIEIPRTLVTSLPSPIPNDNGIIPTIVVRLVSKIGRSLRLQAFSMASFFIFTFFFLLVV